MIRPLEHPVGIPAAMPVELPGKRVVSLNLLICSKGTLGLDTSLRKRGTESGVPEAPYMQYSLLRFQGSVRILALLTVTRQTLLYLLMQISKTLLFGVNSY